MAFGRKKNNRAIDAFGPLDTLIAASQTLNEAESERLARLLLDESFVNAAIRDFGSLPHDEIDQMSNIARIGFHGAKYQFKKQSVSFAWELENARVLVSFILECKPDEIDGVKHAEAIGLSIAATRGGVRMLQLGGEDQALSALAFAVPLIRFACSRSENHES